VSIYFPKLAELSEKRFGRMRVGRPSKADELSSLTTSDALSTTPQRAMAP
jgi:hypothetical protein